MASPEVFAFTHPTGRLFTTSERVALATSLPLLASRTKRRNIVVWGKIYGFKADYIIVQAYDDDLVAEPELYYTVDEGLTFTLLGTMSSLLSGLPNISDSALERQELKQRLVQKMRGMFMGDPAYEYRIVDELSNEMTSYKESVRLALFVEEHDYECRVAPRGAFLKEYRLNGLPAEVKRNTAFCGLRKCNDEALSLNSYYHIRSANPYRRLLARTQHTLYEKGVLEKLAQNDQLDAAFDALVDDVPAGVWRLHYDPMHNLVIGRNARFVGSIFYHVPETTTFGTIYMGDGTINNDLAFEL